MCFNLLAFGKIDRKLLRKIAIAESRINKDGFYFESHNDYVRSLDFGEIIKAIERLEDGKEDFIHMHFRLRTSGKVNIDNIHGWKFANWSFSHNGTVKSFSLSSEKSDSLEFFKKIINHISYNSIDIKALKDCILETGFNGIAFLTNKDLEKAVVISKGKSAKLYYIDDLAIISNDKIDYALSKNEIKIFGEKLKRKDYYYGEFENEIRYINLRKNRVLQRVNLYEKIQKITYYKFPVKYYDDYDWDKWFI